MRRIFAALLSLALLLGCFAIASSAADTDPFRVVATPYEGGIGLHWYTKEALDDIYDAVKIDGAGVPGGGWAKGGLFQGSYAYSVAVPDLPPGPHTYDIGGVTGSFNVDPGKGVDFEFIVTGDTQASGDSGFAYSASTHAAAWRELAGAAFSVVLGDLTNNSDNTEYDQFFSAFAPHLARAAFVPIAGNHDGNLKWNWFRSMFTLKEPDNFWSNLTGVYYSFDYGDAHFAVLNTNDMYPMSAAQQNWFLNDMKASDAKWKIVFTHRPPYTMGNHVNSPDTIPMRRSLIPLFDRAGVDLVMSGHDHIYARTRPMYNDKPVDGAVWALDDPTFVPPAGTVYILPGAACSKRYDLKELYLPVMDKAMVKCEQPGVAIFTGISVAGDTLTYRAWTHNPGTGATAPYDELVITKTAPGAADPNWKPLSTDIFLTLPQHLWNFCKAAFGTLVVDYLFTLLPRLIGG